MKQLLQTLAFALLGAGLLPHTAQAQGPVLDPSFAPTNMVGPGTPGSTPRVYNMVRLSDGKIIVGGFLGVLNGGPANQVVARLLPNGQVDASYQAAAINGGVLDLALQADGKLVIAGSFTTVGGQTRYGLARLLPDGALDAGFVPALGRMPTYVSYVSKIVLQPGVGIIVFGTIILPTPNTRIARLSESTGAWDPTFPVFSAGLDIRDVLPQPNGNLIFASSPRRIGSQTCNVWSTLPDGTLDPAFVPLPISVEANCLVRDPRTGNIYVAAAALGAGLYSEPVRLLPNGALDPTFNTAGAFVRGATLPPGNIRRYRGYAASLAIQPNGRLLLGGDFALGGGSYVGSWRLMPDGSRDLSYQASNGPESAVATVIVQPDGALLFCGSFNQAGGATLNCLARMLDSNVLASNKPQTENDLLAWPVPAHDALHLRLPAGSGPQQIALLDALGRPVRRQAVAAGQTLLTLPVAGLPPGAYLLRVRYAEGAATYRRVVLE